MGLIFIAVLIPFIAPKLAKERILFTFQQGKARSDVVEVLGVKLDTSTSARLKTMKNIAGDWIKHPVFGYGVTGYGFVDAQYFRILIETGILGIFTFFTLITRIFYEIYQNLIKVREPFEKGLVMGFFSGFVGLLFHGIGANTFIIVRIMEPFWFVLAMVIMLPELESEALSGEQGKEIRTLNGQSAQPSTK